MAGNFTGYYVTNNKSNTLLSDLKISLSSICGDLSDEAMIRSVLINPVFKSGSPCNYYNEDSKKT